MKESAEKRAVGLAGAALVGLPRLAAAATGSDMPWEGPIDAIFNSLTGPVLQAGAVGAMVTFGLVFAFGGGGGGIMSRVIGVVFGLSFALAATSFGLDFFGFAGGLAF